MPLLGTKGAASARGFGFTGQIVLPPYAIEFLLVAAGATTGGVYLGGKAAGGQRYGDIFKDSEGQRYRLHKEEQEPEDAIEEMEEATQTKSDLWGPKAAEGLMDIISPIPRQ